MIQAYMALQRDGYAISFETYRQDELVGGLYGVKLGQVLFGESMVSLIPDASKLRWHPCAKNQSGIKFSSSIAGSNVAS